MEGPAESVSSGRMETLLSLIGGGFEGLLGGGGVMMVMMMVIMVIMLVVMLVPVCGSGVDGQHMKCAFGC